MDTKPPGTLTISAPEFEAIPPGLHDDPADRLLVATARHLAIPIVTRDAKILRSAAAGQVQALPC